MNKKILVLIISSIMLLGIFFIPNNTSAQSVNVCKNIYRNLYFGSQGDDVMTLQQFLKDKGYFNFNVTSYFGNMTYNSVVRWQISQGISGIGRVGPQTRYRINQLCTNIVPVENFVPGLTCQTWNDGCNTCSRTSPNSPAACTLRACFAAGKGYCISNFPNTNDNRPPVISQFSGPTTLSVNQTGTWSVVANDPENQQLTYNILWGDENVYYSQNLNSAASVNSFSQTTTFTHSYSNSGNYTVTITVRDTAGNIAKSTSTVQIGNNIICTAEYAPVCGQPPEPACRNSVPACMIATPGPKTYSNRCEMSAVGATYLYSGSCTNGN